MILSLLPNLNIAKLFRECVKLAAIMMKAGAAAILKLVQLGCSARPLSGRAMPLDRADIFSCSDR